ncbi:hypothetical protein C2845_PM11G18290 [Panicum miliaceum]|uniref:GDSL esterase/lipase n=1 Tax=Panicum miliaceum TaxID=4540 RepID=A0A3L6RPJ3_PANMI|nr:hypothetical protein C2845_PM11G18290 [Panicum miliaceum]
MAVRLPAVLLSSICCLLVLLNGDDGYHVFHLRTLVFLHRLSLLFLTSFAFARSLARRVCSDLAGSFHWYNGLFVFGDSFADTGNFPKADLSEVTRQWYKPYGCSHGFLQDPIGRFSNGFVQSDFIGKIMGRTKAPETYKDTKENNGDKFGVNFAVGGAGVFEVPRKAPTLAKQIDSFKKMLDNGDIGKWQLKESVALVAISGKDYARVANMTSESEILSFIGNVTDQIAGGVERLQKLGVTKVLVNTLHPLACTPWQARPSNYTKCMGRGNMAALFHNDDLEKKQNATSSNNVYLLDLN